MKRWLKITLLVLAFALLGLGGYAYYLYHSVKQVMEQTYEPIRKQPANTPKLRLQEPSIAQKDPISILFLGIDQRRGDAGRSDTIMVLTINPNTHQLLMFHIPRDTRTQISGLEKEDKINHAYAFGGVEMAVNTVEAFLQIPIDYYVKVNMNEFVKIIDELGGVDVENKFAFSYEGHSFAVGKLHLKGEEALAYSRMRYDDPKGDLGRNERQRQVIRSLMDKGSHPEVFTKAEAIFSHVQSSVKTNITFEELQQLALDYRSSIQQVDVMEIKGEGVMIDNIYYYAVHTEERKRITQRLQESLGIPSPQKDAAHPPHNGVE
ncbi:LCP family glycopolymer transferase [Brevibacillus migulae]|uniref:LCP family glycopolymer transferase n=1 Tax=Brevibacillus migulae TaxID=1644114 RepID=UPI00142F407A|nr:LCP family protein [Brevibacillus migulae]